MDLRDDNNVRQFNFVKNLFVSMTYILRYTVEVYRVSDPD